MFKRLYYIILQRLYVLTNNRKPCQGKVYMFHNVLDDLDTYSISKNNFEKMISYLNDNKKIVGVDELINNLDRDNVVITFDDAYASVYHEAYPILKELNIPYYIFICLEYLDKDNYLSTSMIKEMLKDSKCILGSHSLKHELSRFKSDSELQNELLESKEYLEKQFNVNVDCFAFPYGSKYAVSDSNIEIANDIYKNVFLTYPLSYNNEYGHLIPRININNNNFQKELR